MKKSEAMELRKIIEEASASLDDKTASEGATLFPRLKEDGSLVEAGTRICWGDKVKKAAVDLWDTKENNPDNAPTIWADLEYRDGYRIIPEVITAEKAFSKDERGWWGDVLYRSIVDGNVCTPEQYADNWEVVR